MKLERYYDKDEASVFLLVNEKGEDLKLDIREVKLEYFGRDGIYVNLKVVVNQLGLERARDAKEV